MIRLLLAVFGLVVVLGATNYAIWKRQQIVDDGRPVLLELRPVDPRSLIQGDYMALRYADSVFPPANQRSGLSARGAFVVRLDDDNVARFVRLDDRSQLAGNEVRLKYKQVDKNGHVRLGAESFFFQEGQADFFAVADYGVLHVDDAGNSVLIGLADEQKRLMVPSGHAAGE